MYGPGAQLRTADHGQAPPVLPGWLQQQLVILIQQVLLEQLVVVVQQEELTRLPPIGCVTH